MLAIPSASVTAVFNLEVTPVLPQEPVPSGLVPIVVGAACGGFSVNVGPTLGVAVGVPEGSAPEFAVVLPVGSVVGSAVGDVTVGLSVASLAVAVGPGVPMTSATWPQPATGTGSEARRLTSAVRTQPSPTGPGTNTRYHVPSTLLPVTSTRSPGRAIATKPWPWQADTTNSEDAADPPPTATTPVAMRALIA